MNLKTPEADYFGCFCFNLRVPSPNNADEEFDSGWLWVMSARG
ncbi:MAG TPA: hypothetical protein VJL10_09470 [Anaerolineales bacterium]|nr:hypothetical protein [Anaerolineales bacterium]